MQRYIYFFTYTSNLVIILKIILHIIITYFFTPQKYNKKMKVQNVLTLLTFMLNYINNIFLL
jgi:hypothetical protein